jgi:hypothetical protein
VSILRFDDLAILQSGVLAEVRGEKIVKSKNREIVKSHA